MAEKTQEAGKGKKKTAGTIKFRCQRCDRMVPLEEMRTVTRFVPALVVCKDCEKELQ